MSTLKIVTRQEQRNYRPGEPVEGVAGWQMDEAPTGMQVRLFWYTRGKGGEDVDVVMTVPFEQPLREEARPFRLNVPEVPYSFSGKLISLIWAIEIVAEPSKESARFEITVSPTGEEVILGEAGEEKH